MEVSFRGRTIRMERELSSLDRLALKFSKKLEKRGISYAIVSGYVAIVFGRSRSSEDIDVIVEKLSGPEFKKLWRSLEGSFECVNAGSAETAYDYLVSGTAVRFSAPGRYVPNIEMKFPKNPADDLALRERLKLLLNSEYLYIAPLEPQICYKLSMKTEKDVEDARFLFKLLRPHLDVAKVKKLAREMGVGKDLKFLGL
jgi:hypothetical protein